MMIESEALQDLRANAAKLKKELEDENKHKHHTSITYLGFVVKHAYELDKNLCALWNRLPREKYDKLG